MKTAAKDFKITELGPIPKDWEVWRIGDLSSLITKGTTPTSIGCEYVVNGINFIKAESITDEGLFLPEMFAHIDDETNRLLSRSQLARGDYLFSIAGVLGRVACVQDGVLPANTNQALAIIRLSNGVDVDRRFIFYSLKAKPIEDYISNVNVAAAQANLSLENVADLPMVLPPLPEQRKIAAVLSDVDEMIAALEKLIEKKRKIKTGAMQRLLTGKTRLPGFKGAWVEKRLGDVLQIGHGKDYKHLQAGMVPVYGTGGLMTYVNEYLYDGETVCIGRKGTIDRPFYHDGKIWTVDTLFFTHSFVEVVPRFLAYKFEQVDWLSYNEATGVPSLTSKAIEDVVITVPITLAEQKAIAKVLGDIDEEIAALEAELAKTRQLKQGMMQELLTGRVRLV